VEIGFFLRVGVEMGGFEVGILGFSAIFVFFVDGMSSLGIDGFFFFGVWVGFWWFLEGKDFLGVFSVIFGVFSVGLGFGACFSALS
jgi:hypothetical protein